MSFSLPHLLLLVLVVVLLFGTGRVSRLMEDAAKGIKAFKRGMQDDAPSASARRPRGKKKPAKKKK